VLIRVASLQWVAAQGITLTNYFAITHPSQPNYVAVVGGSTNSITSDSHLRIDSSKKTIVDLLDAKGVSWGEYQEDSPYSGFQSNYVNQKNGKNDYVRKHNPLMSYDSVTSDLDKLAKIKNLTMFHTDLKNNKLPQWLFITPNMTSDGHDTSVTTAGTWTKNFLQPLLSDANFASNTLILLSSWSSSLTFEIADWYFAAFDETESYTSDNKVFSVLLGDAVPSSLHGTTKADKYNHYSAMATVENNWDLGNLGLADKTAAAFFWVGILADSLKLVEEMWSEDASNLGCHIE